MSKKIDFEDLGFSKWTSLPKNVMKLHKYLKYQKGAIQYRRIFDNRKQYVIKKNGNHYKFSYTIDENPIDEIDKKLCRSVGLLIAKNDVKQTTIHDYLE